VVKVGVRLEGTQLGETHVVRVQMMDPAGQELAMLTRNLAAPAGACTWNVPLALNLSTGTYSLHVREVATGAHAQRLLTVW
jgi:hypothetical protein